MPSRINFRVWVSPLEKGARLQIYIPSRLKSMACPRGLPLISSSCMIKTRLCLRFCSPWVGSNYTPSVLIDLQEPLALVNRGAFNEGQEFLPRLFPGTKHAQHGACDGRGILLLDAAHHHAEV